MAGRVRRFATIPPGDPRLAEGLRLFRSGRYFEAHDAWEALWHEVGDPQREWLQGLIQVAVARHHLARGRASSAAYLLGRAELHRRRGGRPRLGIALAALIRQAAREAGRLTARRGAAGS